MNPLTTTLIRGRALSTGLITVNANIQAHTVTANTAVKTDSIDPITGTGPVQVTGDGLEANNLIANTAVKTLTISPTDTNTGPVQVTAEGLEANNLIANTGKSAFVLFCCVAAYAQYKVLTTWLFYLTIVCLY